MYNSYTVNLLSRLWRTINSYYSYSFIKKVSDITILGLKAMLSGSHIVRFITNEKSLIEKSIFYNLYRKLISISESLFNKLRELIKQYKEGSFLCKLGSSVFESDSTTIEVISLFIIAFSAFNILIDTLNNSIKTRGNAVLFIAIVMSIIIYKYKNNIKGAIEQSLFIKLLKDIFTIDDGGDQWW